MNKRLRKRSIYIQWLVCLIVGFLAGCGNDDLPKRSFPQCTPPAAQLGSTAQLLDVSFSLESTTGTIGTVIWDFGDGSQKATIEKTTKHTFTIPGTYKTSAKLTNACGDTVKISKEIIVDNTVPPIVTTLGYSDLNVTTATLTMKVDDKGNGKISRYGICYSATQAFQPDTANATTVSIRKDLAISTPASFSVDQLLAGTVYYYRGFAINNAGITYGSVISFLTSSPPSVITVGSSSVGTTTASVTFTSLSEGNPPATRYGICYSSTTNAPTLNSPGSLVATVASPAMGTTTLLTLTNLLPNTTYSYRAFATSAVGTVYSTNTLSFTTKTNIDLTTGLIGSYAFDGTGTDASGNNNNGTLKGGAGYGADRNGKANAALQLDGTSGYFDIPDAPSLRPSTLSVSVWIKPASLTRIMQIYNKSNFEDGSGEQYSSLIRLAGSGSGITVNVDVKQHGNCEVGKGWQNATFTSSLTLNTWHHVVSVFEGNTGRLYFDGILISTSPLTYDDGIDNCPGGSLKFGAQYKGFDNYFNGSIDDIRIYNRALTATQVSALYNQ